MAGCRDKVRSVKVWVAVGISQKYKMAGCVEIRSDV